MNEIHFKSLKKLLKYFNSIAISTPFVLSTHGVLPVITVINLNYSEFAMLQFGISLQYCNTLPDVFAKLLLHSCISITISKHSLLLTCVLFIWLIQLMNRAQCLNVTCLLIMSAHFPGAFALALVFVIVPFISI